MAVTGKDILTDAAELLFDNDHVRWTLPELVRWLNAGMRDICLAKPSANSSTRILTLAAGTLQSVPTATNLSEPLQLIDVVRNITADGPPRVAGRTIKTVSRDILDSENPNWHNSKYLRFRAEVRNVCFDEQNPLEFYVYPGNDGTGKVEAVVAQIPAPIVATGDVTLIDSYNTEIDLPDIYASPLLDYVLARAYSKDEEGNYDTRSQMHEQKFAAAIGLKIQVEGASSPNSRRARP